MMVDSINMNKGKVYFHERTFKLKYKYIEMIELEIYDMV